MAKKKQKHVPPTVEQVKAEGYTEEAAEKIAAQEQEKFQKHEGAYADDARDPDAPTFELRADDEFGFRAMLSIAREFPRSLPDEFRAKLREFELYEEANRS